MPLSRACFTSGSNALLPGCPMISMQSGFAATACRNCSSIFSGCHAEYCSTILMPNASPAASAPLVRAHVAPSPALPPICMYITRPLPSGSAACDALLNNATAPVSAIAIAFSFIFVLLDCGCGAKRVKQANRQPGSTTGSWFKCEHAYQPRSPLRLLHCQMENHRSEKYQSNDRAHPESL